MFFDDTDRHHRPHVHAYYGGHNASVGLDGELLAGDMPLKQLRMVQAWIAIHEDELYRAWTRALRHEPAQPIAPLS
ncbi:MAG: DUF4160 domain-containing protein [Propionibacteriaceae bacterium]|jgi:hypothetical protein|nr:DUF4160 domain-containing protein [Propionibacteriaceae bacterium]